MHLTSKSMEIAISPRYLIASTAGFISRGYYNVCSWLESAANRNLRGCSDLRSFVADQVHQYDRINLETLWDVIHQDIPQLLSFLQPLLSEGLD
jgi:hypothetical protein